MQSKKGRTVLMHAILADHTRLWKYLITTGADANQIYDENAKNGINISDYSHKRVMISKYLSMVWDDTFLHKAVREDSPLIIYRLVLENELDVNRKGKDGWTALHLAAFMNRAACIVTLLELSANPALLTDMGQYTAMHLATSKGNKEAVLRLLFISSSVPSSSVPSLSVPSSSVPSSSVPSRSSSVPSSLAPSSSVQPT